MPRSIWNGTVALGLVSVPVKLYSATESKTIHFTEVHARDGAKIEHRRVDPKTGKEVPYEEVAKGYQVSERKWVVLSKEQVAAADGRGAKVIDVEDVVPGEQIDPVYYDRAYHLGPGADGAEAYRLLHDALARTGRAAIGKVVLRSKEQLVAIRARDDALCMHTMRFADEVVDPGDVEVPAPSKKPAKREVDMAAALVDTLAEKWRPESYEDTYRDAVLEIVKRKAKGEEIEPAVATEPPVDLLAALEASVKGSKRSGGGR